MKSLLLINIAFLTIVASGCGNKQNETQAASQPLTAERTFDLPDSLSSRRLSFVLDLRKEIAQKHWEGFADKEVEGTFIYFNGDHSEIFFPSQIVLDKLENYTTHSEDYVLSPRTDTIPYHFELMISLDPADSARFYYDHPVQQFLSVEETGNYIPSVSSTELWTNMVIHEMFHHFQYNSPAFIKYAKETIGPLPSDIRDLNRLCRDDPGFLKAIQKENDYLMDALTTEDAAKRDAVIDEYLEARARRIRDYSSEHPVLATLEDYYIIQEGSARYIEYQSIMVLSDWARQSDRPLIENDPMFNSYEDFKEVDLEGDVFGYLTYAGVRTYYYALGFNTMRLLDKLGVDYKGNLLEHPEKALHSYLEEYLNSASPNRPDNRP